MKAREIDIVNTCGRSFMFKNISSPRSEGDGPSICLLARVGKMREKYK